MKTTDIYLILRPNIYKSWCLNTHSIPTNSGSQLFGRKIIEMKDNNGRV